MHVGLPGGSVVNHLPNAGEVGLIPGSGRLPEEGNSNPLQYSCLGNPIYISISHCGFKLHFPNSY